MNPYNYYPPYMQQQAQPVQQLPQPRADTKVYTYFVDTAEQMSSITPLPSTLYLGVSNDGTKIFQRRMNNNGLVETKVYSVVGEQTKKTDTQEILGRLESIEKKLNIGVTDESTNVA